MNKNLRRNHEISASSVRLIGADDKQIGVVSFTSALEQAKMNGLDLVEVVPSRADEPPVCKVMDYGKYLYQLRKNLDAARKHQHQPELKEVRFTPRIGDGDFHVKVRSIRKFIENGDKVKVTVRFRGREMAYKEQGAELLKQIELETQEFSSIENEAKFEGKQMVMVLSPKRESTKRK